MSMGKLQNSRDLAHLHGVKVIGYGDAGAGKTRLCGTAPAPVIFSAESGMLTLRNLDLPVWTVNTLADLQDAFRWVSGSTEANQFQTVCLDSLSEIAEVVLAAEKIAKKDARQAYMELQEQVLSLVRGFRDLPGKHVYMAAKMSPMKDDESGLIKYAPAMPGQKLGPALPYLFDEVFHMGVGYTQEGAKFYYLRTQLSNRYTAKDRSGALDEFEPPDLTHVFNKILGG